MPHYATARATKVEGASFPRDKRGRRPGQPVVVDTLLRMKVGECYDINRCRGVIEEMARRLRRQYDMERKWTVRPADKPNWSRVWRVL